MKPIFKRMLELEEVLGMDVDISIIEIGWAFDNPPFNPFE